MCGWLGAPVEDDPWFASLRTVYLADPRPSDATDAIGKRYISLTEATIQTSESSFRILPVRIAAEVARLVIDSLVLNFANRDPGTLAVMAAALQERLEEIEGGAQPVDG
jgi:hypothetical protein